MRLTLLTLSLLLFLSAPQVATSQVGVDGSAFLDRPYTLRDRAIDRLRQDAIEWATEIDGGDFSRELEEGALGLMANGTAYLRPGTRGIIVDFDFGVQRILGDRRTVCLNSVRIAYSTLLPPGKDIYGNNLAAKYMRERIGAATAQDTAAARRASEALVEAITVYLHIGELATQTEVTCSMGSRGPLSFEDSRDQP